MVSHRLHGPSSLCSFSFLYFLLIELFQGCYFYNSQILCIWSILLLIISNAYFISFNWILKSIISVWSFACTGSPSCCCSQKPAQGADCRVGALCGCGTQASSRGQQAMYFQGFLGGFPGIQKPFALNVLRYVLLFLSSPFPQLWNFQFTSPESARKSL